MNKAKTVFKYRTNRVAAAVFLIICIIMSAMCSLYYVQLQTTVKEESYEYLQEICKQIGNNVSRSMSDNFSVLGTIASVIKTSNIESYEDLQPIILAQQTYWDYKNLLLIDAKGNAIDAYGGTTILGADASVREAVVNKTRSMSPSQLVNGLECILFVVPVEGLTVSGTEICAIAATYELSSFDRILSLSAFSGYGYAHIIKSDGTTVVRTSSTQAQKAGYNIINSLTNAKFEDKMTLATLKTDVKKGNSGAVTYTLNGKRMYMVHTALEMEGWHLAGFVPVNVVNSRSNLLLQMTLLLCATLTLAFATLIGYVIFSNVRYKRKLEGIAYVDPVTGGNTIQRFYEYAPELLGGSNGPQYAVVYLNIEKFKLLNEEFGKVACDDMLKCIYAAISNKLVATETVARVSADNLVVLIEYTTDEDLKTRFEEWVDAAINMRRSNGGIWLSPIICFGVYIISNTTLPITQMIDRAKLALREHTIELRGKLHYAMYDDGIHRRLLREKHLEDMMEESLEKGEFKVYLQPKYKTQSEIIGGAEALVRWDSAIDGMIFPDEFISLFEKNGFIVQLDMWVFEEVCRSIRAWIDAGKQPVRVSVNCSRIHLRNHLFLATYKNVCEKWNVPTKHIEIELTENIVFEDVGHLSKIISDIREAGFGCSMDDFGSGYSSLNMIQDIPVDTLKLDKVFFKKRADASERTKFVVGSIISMAKSLNMYTVAEGVEERSQVEMLKELGCDMIQGYFFAKPMPIAAFEELAFGKAVYKQVIECNSEEDKS